MYKQKSKGNNFYKTSVSLICTFHAESINKIKLKKFKTITLGQKPNTQWSGPVSKWAAIQGPLHYSPILLDSISLNLTYSDSPLKWSKCWYLHTTNFSRSDESLNLTGNKSLANETSVSPCTWSYQESTPDHHDAVTQPTGLQDPHQSLHWLVGSGEFMSVHVNTTLSW